MKSYFIKLTSYNLWANQLITSFIKEAGDNAFDLIQSGSFPTIRGTLDHISGAEKIWLLRLQGTSLNEWPSSEAEGNMTERCNQLISVSESFAGFTKEADDNFFNEILSYKNLKGDSFTGNVSDILAHVMNHSTFHRGQIVNLLRGAGFTNLKSTDFITFTRF